MSQRAFLTELDASLHAAFAAAGMADSGLYTAVPGAVPVPCQVYVTRDVETIGDLRQFKAHSVEIDYVLGSLALAGVELAQKGRLLVDGDLYENATQVSNDSSMSRWKVRHVKP